MDNGTSIPAAQRGAIHTEDAGKDGSGVMDVRIQYCTLCWGYRDLALILAAALRQRFDVTLEVVGARWAKATCVWTAS